MTAGEIAPLMIACGGLVEATAAATYMALSQRSAAARVDPVGDTLRRVYDEVLHEPVPARLTATLAKLPDA